MPSPLVVITCSLGRSVVRGVVEEVVVVVVVAAALYRVAPGVGPMQGVLALGRSEVEELPPQLEQLPSMSPEEKEAIAPDRFPRTDSRSDFSNGLSTMVIVHFCLGLKHDRE